jgi:anti-anti-sigma factor
LSQQPFDTDRVVVVDVEPHDRRAGPPTALTEKLARLLDQGVQCILLNVADVVYVDSVLLGAMMQAYTSAIRHGGTLKLLHASQRLRELLVVTKLDSVLETVDSPDLPESGAGTPDARLIRGKPSRRQG